jgi:hypothetical protein
VSGSAGGRGGLGAAQAPPSIPLIPAKAGTQVFSVLGSSDGGSIAANAPLLHQLPRPLTQHEAALGFRHPSIARPPIQPPHRTCHRAGPLIMFPLLASKPEGEDLMERVDYESLIIQDLLNFNETKSLNISPWYQRRSVWTAPQQSYLINTIFEKKPVPSLYIRHHIDLDSEHPIAPSAARPHLPLNPRQPTCLPLEIAQGRGRDALAAARRAGERVLEQAPEAGSHHRWD